MKLAVLLANRGFFPSSVISSAENEMKAAFARTGLEYLSINADMTRFGAVETAAEGAVFADFLAAHDGEYDGLVICLPNFGDENGIKTALKNCRVPILIQAYPDDLAEMDFDHRRDAFCGKLALTSVLTQMGIPYTSFTPFTIHPNDPRFDEQLRTFAGICRIVKKLRGCRIGMVGARTTAFKSVRFDEMAMERHGIDVEDLDLSSVFSRIRTLSADEPAVQKRLADLHRVMDCTPAPAGRDVTLAKLAAVLDDMVAEQKLDSFAIRCWSEFQQELGISPCAVMGLLNQEGIPAACETDVCHALSMLGLSAASELGVGCLDWNNNYGDDPNRCILFHCGPLPMDLMEGPGVMQQHKMLSKTYGQDCSWGLNVGKMKTGTITFVGLRTENGEIQYYTDTAEIVDAPLSEEFFGVHAVIQTEDLQRKLQNISKAGFRHHVTIARGDVKDMITETFSGYLGYRRIEI